jgi:hypothetical protein
LDSSISQGPFSVAPCQTLISRFATFSSLYSTPDEQKWVYPTIDAATGLWARVLAKSKLKVAGVKWSGGSGDYKTDPENPTGFWPMYLDVRPDPSLAFATKRATASLTGVHAGAHAPLRLQEVLLGVRSEINTAFFAAGVCFIHPSDTQRPTTQLEGGRDDEITETVFKVH